MNTINKIKHNKIKNTGLLFEVLIRNFSIDVLNGGDGNIPKRLIKKYFTHNTELGKELSLYNTLTENHGLSEYNANSIITSSIELRKSLNENKLKKEKYNLVKEISESYDIKSFFNVKLNNYKLMASCYKIFEFDIKNDIPSDLINSKMFIQEHLTRKELTQPIEKDIKSYLSNDKDTRLLIVKEMVKGFNKNYSSNLSQKQNDIINIYVNKNTSDPNFKKNINLEIDYLLHEFYKVKKVSKLNEGLDIKLNISLNNLEKIKDNRIIDETNILTLLRFHDLLDELRG
jgi:hypothetical protein